MGSKDRPNRQVIKWDEWVILPVQYCELARESVVCIRLLDFATEECLGSSVFELFSEDGEFRHGKRDICVWPRTKPDPGNNLTHSAPLRIKILPPSINFLEIYFEEDAIFSLCKKSRKNSQ